MNETLKVLETRRSCRNFKPDMIKDEELKEEELDQVSGGVIIPGKPPVNPPAREKPIGEEPAKSSRN